MVALTASPAATAFRTEPALRECAGCGLFQIVPALTPGQSAVCSRCGTLLRNPRPDAIDRSLALNLTALILLGVVCTTTLLTVQKAGIMHQADLFSGPDELLRRGMSPLAAAVIFTTLLAPAAKFVATLYVLVRIRMPRPPPGHLRIVFRWAGLLGPWSMLEVFLFGVFVAYVKLGGLVTIGIGPGVYALLALIFVLIWADASLDRQAVWEELDRAGSFGGGRPRPAVLAPGAGATSCEQCGLVSIPTPGRHTCPRCDAALHPRKPDSITRTWALVAAAAVLYVPANLYPVLTVVQLGAGQPSTIMGGVRELIESRMYPLAALVFTASIAVPMLKLVSLSIMLVATQTERSFWLRDRVRLYRVVRWIGRWSMIDIFMEALLGALVRFGSVVTIVPGVGAVAFCAVVILTIIAAESFDPRLMWDAAARGRERRSGQHTAGQA